MLIAGLFGGIIGSLLVQLYFIWYRNYKVNSLEKRRIIIVRTLENYYNAAKGKSAKIIKFRKRKSVEKS